jgi:hypothetical protein
MENVGVILTHKLTGKRPLRGLGIDGEDNIRIDLEIYNKYEQLGSFGSGYGLLESPP